MFRSHEILLVVVFWLYKQKTNFQFHFICYNLKQASDCALPYVLDNLTNSINSASHPKPDRVRLSLQSCDGFIGIFLGELSSTWLQDILDQFVSKTDNDLGKNILFLLFNGMNCFKTFYWYPTIIIFNPFDIVNKD